MPEFKDLPDDFRCPYRDGCPYLEGLSTSWVFHRYQEVAGTECQYEYQLQELYKELDEERRQRKQSELKSQQLQAQLSALHRRQFKGRSKSASSTRSVRRSNAKNAALLSAIQPGCGLSPNRLTSLSRFPRRSAVQSARAPTCNQWHKRASMCRRTLCWSRG